MDVILMIVYATIVLGVLVFVHEGGHYLAAKAFGVRVTEFMLGLPGPSIGFTWKGTRFGVTAIPLGGYARICGMESGEQSPHLEQVLSFVYEKGTVNMEDVSGALKITDDEAYHALEELTEWGSIVGPTKKDSFNTYRTPVEGQHAMGDPRLVDNSATFFENEFKQQYRSLPFWKRSIILLAGVVVNLLFAIVLFVLIYSVIGIDMVSSQTGEMIHYTTDPLHAIQVGFSYIGMVVQAVVGLFNPATAVETVSQSTSIMGIAVISKEYADAGLAYFLVFMAMISVSLGIMNLLPIPPLDGGRFIVEVFQKITRKIIPVKVLNYLSAAGLILFIGFFVVMLNQDVQRFIFGNW